MRKLKLLFEHNAVGLYGDNGVEGVHLVKRMGEADEGVMTWLSTAFSWLSAISLIPIFSNRMSTPTKRANIPE